MTRMGREDATRAALLGRRREQRLLTELVDRARQGRSGTLVLRGDAGIGKTTLLSDAIADAPDLRTIQISGAESELELAYAGVQQLCTSLLTGLDRLPQPQRDALEVALGLRSGAVPDRLLVGLAILSLLGEAGAGHATICVIDDAQWVDHASMQALAFVARRLAADPVVMIFAARPFGAEELAGLPELVVGSLADADARALLEVVLPGRIDETVRENILTEADGNPLALLELQGALAPAALAGGYGLAAAEPVATRIEQTFGRRLRELPQPARTLLLLAASEPTGEPTWLWAAAARLDVPADASVPAEKSGLVTVDSRLRFRHPLVRSAIYRSASPSERQQAHAALAEVISGPTADEHRAWHRAHATNAPDEAVATALVDAAERARRRGGAAAAAAFLAYAVEVTPDPVDRAERALAAARAKLDAADPPAATRLLAWVAAAGSELLDARADLVRAKVAFAARRGRDAPPLLLAAAERLRSFDPVLARETYLEALMAAMITGRLYAGEHTSAAAMAEAARHAPPPSDPPTSVDLFLDGLVVRLIEGHGPAASLLTRAVEKYLEDEEAGTADPRWHDITNRVMLDLFLQDTYYTLNARQTAMLRAAGELTVLSAALTTYAGACVTAGDFTAAAELLEQSDAIATAISAPPHRSIRTYLAACRGRDDEAQRLAEATIREATERGEGSEVTVVLFSLAVLHNGLAHYEDAFRASATALEFDDVGMTGHLLNEQVEAAARTGRRDIAESAAGRLIERAAASPTPTALGYAARARALLSSGPDAEGEYLTAIAELENAPLDVLTARTHLIFGEWLRRANRRADASSRLRVAYEKFVQMGADGLAERARRELHAAGEPQRKERGDISMTTLTTQESYIARLAGDGYTNSEIAAHLFLSPRTVEWHLSKIFVKLGVSSRRELRRLRGE
ncbi:LuxR family transcriptional regulator [Mycolicibacterium sp. F2034L]|uniref:helix-turn-helix transcriptional regulator n=1 Tax=Mycolicibacterium sp. F2034L TaxID=2926422 RepID=UPI001FF2E19C|nr:LuxR family transcriptional regulator [Mycolicibacterium sp. F2034L]MCK0172767.1 AAA family ATPase [Mycolicibacterium sp. F2034L]